MNIPLFKMYWDSEDVRSVTRAVKSGKDWAIGPKIEEFETLLAKYNGVKYAVSCNSGTSALHMLMAAYDIGPGDEVIVPSFTFIATANAPIFTGAKPVFAEIEEESYGLDPDDVEKKITKNTKAILPIHYAGCPCKIRELAKIAKRHNLLLIEDAAEAMGAKAGSKMAGSLGDASVLSFCASKIATTGEGGAVLTNSQKIYNKLRLLRSHGREESENYFTSSKFMDYVQLGYNMRMSNITAALAVSQLKKIDKLIKMRQDRAEYLTRKLSPIKEVKPLLPAAGQEHVYQMYTIRVGGGGLRDKLKDYLNKKGIAAKVYFSPVHLTNFYRDKFGYNEGDFPVTEKLSDQVLTLPLYPSLKRTEMEYMAGEIEKFFKHYGKK